MDKEKVIKGLECCKETCAEDCPYWNGSITDCSCMINLHADAFALFKEYENLLGIHQTTDGITFISSGTAKQGEDRGIMLGKAYMHEWLQKELLYRCLMTDEIRKVFADASSL